MVGRVKRFVNSDKEWDHWGFGLFHQSWGDRMWGRSPLFFAIRFLIAADKVISKTSKATYRPIEPHLLSFKL
jgi:hypothetical protein